MSKQELADDVCEHGTTPPGVVVSMADQIIGLGFSVDEGAVLGQLVEAGRKGAEESDPLTGALGDHADGGSDVEFARAAIGSYET